MENDTKYHLQKSESSFLRGPRSRFKEFIFTLKVQYNFIKGFRKMHFIGPCVTVFGSAHFRPDSKHFQNAEKIGAYHYDQRWYWHYGIRTVGAMLFNILATLFFSGMIFRSLKKKT